MFTSIRFALKSGACAVTSTVSGRDHDPAKPTFASLPDIEKADSKTQRLHEQTLMPLDWLAKPTGQLHQFAGALIDHRA